MVDPPGWSGPDSGSPADRLSRFKNVIMAQRCLHKVLHILIILGIELRSYFIATSPFSTALTSLTVGELLKRARPLRQILAGLNAAMGPLREEALRFCWKGLQTILYYAMLYSVLHCTVSYCTETHSSRVPLKRIPKRVWARLVQMACM